MNCNDCKSLFAEAYYGEMDAASRVSFEEHIANCSPCATEYRAMSDLLDMMAKREIPEPSSAFVSSYWETLEPKLSLNAEKPASANTGKTAKPTILAFPVVSVPRWVYGIAAVVLIALGVYIGRMVPGGTTAGTNTVVASRQLNDTARTVSDDEVQNYLDRSRALLMGVVNNESPSPEMLERQRTVSRELAQKAVFLKSSLKAGDDQSLRKLVGDLEVVLLQLANYSNDTGIPVVELVRQGVDQKSIMLKINIEQIRSVTAREKVPAPVKPNTRKTGI